MRELREQLQSALLMMLTVAAVIAAAINFQQQGKFRLPDDGATWTNEIVEGERRPVASFVAPGSPAEKAGLREGDVLVSIAGVRVNDALEAPRVLVSLGAWTKTDYRVLRGGAETGTSLVIGEAARDWPLYYLYAVGALYLAIGMFVFFRRGAAPRGVHFFLLCLTSFILFTFHYSGKLNNFDQVIYLANVVCSYLVPALFLHFCFSFPDPQRWIRKSGAAILAYVPALALLGVHLAFNWGWVHTNLSLLEVRWLLDRVNLGFLCGCFALGAVVLAWQKRRASDPIVRKQLSWLRNGAVVGVLPFTLFYAVPYVAGFAPTDTMHLAVLSLPLVPLTWAYAILRYRLMDVDIIFEEGAVYTLATLCILGVFYGLIFSLSGTGDVTGPGMIALILVAAFIFQPVRNWIREQLDRYYFYKDRYDYRRTLIEFARELGSPTDLHQMLESVADRLIHTLNIRHVAVFVWDEQGERFGLELAANRAGDQTHHVPTDLDLSFLRPSPRKPYLFFERTRHTLDVVSHEMPVEVRRSIADLELTYYLPCNARGRTIAYLGVSRTETGDFLSSEDVQLLVTLSSYVGIAIDNSKLYASLQRKADEYERLKEYSENIVESIHVGIAAVDLGDRVESWNSQMEKLTGVARKDAMGQPLYALLPGDLCEQLAVSHEQSGVLNIYKYEYKTREATLNIATAPLVSKEAERIGRLIIFDDVTDREELERRLVQADKLSSIGLLAAGVAHEVNTPLAVISTYAQMLAKQISGDEQKAPLLEKITRQTFRASEIVNSLLSFSRTSPTEFVSTDLNKTAREAVGLLEHQLVKARVQVDWALDEALPAIKGNPGKLQQVILNLAMNARDAMDEGGVLHIATVRREGAIELSVSDTGSGIAPEALPRIFDPFYTTKGAKKGTGLGLAVSYGIVREHGGEIEVVSQPSRGTTFTLVFPVAGQAAGTKPEIREVAPQRGGNAPAAAAVARTEVPAAAASIRISAQTDRIIR